MSSDLSEWRALDYAPPESIEGTSVRMERLSAERHAAALHGANGGDAEAWAYMAYGPWADGEIYRGWVEAMEASDDPAFYAIEGPAGWSGVASYLRIDRTHGTTEIGHIALATALRRTVAATEAIHLLIDRAFGAGFRRVEWKCNAANEASWRAAARYGFGYEGTFRQHMVTKGTNRDTAWFAILDGDWPAIRAAHRAWLEPENFDTDGRQRRALAGMVAEAQRTGRS